MIAATSPIMSKPLSTSETASPKRLNGVRRRLSYEIHRYSSSGRTNEPPREFRERLAALLHELGLLKEALTVRKIRDRAVRWQINANYFLFEIERHPARMVVWQTWRYFLPTGRFQKLGEVRENRGRLKAVGISE